MDTVTRLCRGELDELLKTPSAPKDTRVGGSANKVARRIVAFHDLFDRIKLARQSYDHIFDETAEEIGRLNSTKEAHLTEAGLAQLRADVDVSSALSITNNATILLHSPFPRPGLALLDRYSLSPKVCFLRRLWNALWRSVYLGWARSRCSLRRLATKGSGLLEAVIGSVTEV
jgi:hypothetical protein